MQESVTSPDLFRFGLFEVDCAREVLVRNGVRVRLQNQPFRVLVLLLERRGEIVTREELKEALWPDGTHVDFDGSLNVILKKLRAAIDDDSDNPRFIETVPRRGYRFIAPVVAASTAPIIAIDSAAVRESAPATQGNAPKGTGTVRLPRWSWLVAAGLLLLSASAVVYRYAGKARTLAQAASSREVASLPPASLRPAIAVLGFRNLTGRPEDAWLSAALSEMLGTELSGDGQLRLASGQDVENLRTSAPWPQTDSLDQQTAFRIGSALSSDWLVLGSFTVVSHTEPANLRLDVRLQKATTGQIVSEFSQVGTEVGIFQLVSQVGERLRDHLGVAHMVERDAASILSAQPLDRDAARFYSLGVARLNQYDALGARDLLEQAVQVDPKFSLAHAALSAAWGGLGYGEKSAFEAKRALDLSSDLPQQLRMRVQAQYFASIGHLEQVASIDRALFELYPDNVEYGLSLAAVENESGHASQARDAIARLRALPAPASDDPRIDLGASKLAEKRDDALGLIRSAVTKASAQGNRVLYAQARRDECMNLLWGDHPERGPAACNDAYQVFLAVGDRAGAADALRLLADGEGAQGQFEEALATYRRALAYTQDLGEHEKTGAILNNMAIVLANQGKLDDAEKMYRDAKDHFEAAGNIGNMSTALVNIADIVYMRGKLDRAEALYRQALALQSKLDPANPGYLLSRLADLELTEGRVKEAQLDASTAKDAMKKEQGAYQYYTAAMNEMGDALKAQGRLSDARAIYDEAMSIRKRVGEVGLVAEEQLEIADLLLEQNRPVDAEPLIRSALTEFEKENSDPAKAFAYVLLSQSLLKQGKVEEAGKASQRALALSQTSPDPALRLPAAIQSARVEAAAALAEGRNTRGVSSALQKMRAAAASARQMGYFNFECEARLAIGEITLAVNASSGRAELAALAEDAGNKGYGLIAQQAVRLNKLPADQVARIP